MIQHKKNTHKPTSANPNKNKPASRLSTKSKKTYLNHIPDSMDPDSPHIDLSNNRISSLKGIHMYTNLQYLNLSHNNISQYQQISHLRSCPKLQQLCINDNPICTNINYMYNIMCVLGRLVAINGVRLSSNLGEITRWQNQNGSILYEFMWQCCIAMDQLLTNKYRINRKLLQQQLVQLSTIFNSKNASKPQQIIQDTNRKIHQHLHLKCIDSHRCQLDADQIQQLRNYHLDKIIQIGAKANSQFISSILDRVEVCGDQQQSQLVNKPEVTKYILKDLIQKQFQHTRPLGNKSGAMNVHIQEHNQQLKHFTSADTALTSLQTAKRSEFNSITSLKAITFSLDVQYLKILRIFVAQQISRLLSSVNHYNQNNNSHPPMQTGDHVYIQSYNTYEDQERAYDQQYQHTDKYQIKSQAQQLQIQQIGKSPRIIYNNPLILSNILSVLQNCFKRIAFRRINKCRSRIIVSCTISKIELALASSLKNRLKLFFIAFQQIQRNQQELLVKLQNKRLKRIFHRWKNINQRKTKLLKRIINKKFQMDQFTTAITMLKWKMNARAFKLKEMVNLSILKSDDQTLPRSKKGIQLAYQRVISNRKFNI